MSTSGIYLFLIAFLCASATLPAIQLAFADDQTLDVPLPRNESDEYSGWRITLQPGWLHVNKRQKKGTQVFAAPHGLRGAIIIKEEEYVNSKGIPFASKKLFDLRKAENVQIINSEVIVISDQPGTISLYQSASFIVFEVYVSSGKRGYTIQCSGKFDSFEEASAVCEEPLSTFRLLG